MPYDLNRVPVGLKDLLGGNSWAQFQHEIADQLVTVFDARAEYLARQIQCEAGSQGIIAAGFTTAIGLQPVPFNAWYWIENFTLWQAAGAGVGDTWEVAPAIVIPQTIGGGSSYLIGPTTRATSGQWLGVNWPVRMWVPPATAFHIFAKEKAGANPTVSSTLVYTRVAV